MLLSYLERRAAWDRASATSSAGPGDAKWDELRQQLIAIHADLCTPGQLSNRDTSASLPSPRDPSRTSLLDVRWVTDTKVVMITAEDDPLGILDPQTYEVVALLVDTQWRLDERTATYENGTRITGLL